MKKIFFSSFAVIILFVFVYVFPISSCKKEKVVTNTDTVFKCVTSPLGLWEGTTLTDQVSHPPRSIAFVFYSDSSMSRKSKDPLVGDIYTRGTWKMVNNKITFKDTTLNFTPTAIQTGSFDYDATNNTLLNGKWNHPAVSYSGTLSTMQKKK